MAEYFKDCRHDGLLESRKEKSSAFINDFTIVASCVTPIYQSKRIMLNKLIINKRDELQQSLSPIQTNCNLQSKKTHQ